MQKFFFEVYVREPITWRPGYDIEVGTVAANSGDEAAEKIAKHFGAMFDCFIQCHEVTKDFPIDGLIVPAGYKPTVIE